MDRVWQPDAGERQWRPPRSGVLTRPTATCSATKVDEQRVQQASRQAAERGARARGCRLAAGLRRDPAGDNAAGGADEQPLGHVGHDDRGHGRAGGPTAHHARRVDERSAVRQSPQAHPIAAAPADEALVEEPRRAVERARRSGSRRSRGGHARAAVVKRRRVATTGGGRAPPARPGGVQVRGGGSASGAPRRGRPRPERRGRGRPGPPSDAAGRATHPTRSTEGGEAARQSTCTRVQTRSTARETAPSPARLRRML